MSYRHYKVRDYQFGSQSLQLREKIGLTQMEVATALQVTERAIQHWEGGSSRPTTANLRKLIALYLAHGAFSSGQEREEAHSLWEQACINTPRRHSSFDDNWFTSLLKKHRYTLKSSLEGKMILVGKETLAHGDAEIEQQLPPVQPPVPIRKTRPTVDWGETFDISTFYGRERELAELEQWIVNDGCRLVVLLGIGGIGKTALSVKIAQQIAPQFEFVLWRSLRNAPLFEEIIVECIQFFSEQQYLQLPQSSEKRISVLIDLLREKRCLLVFDNIEALLQEGNPQGHYREGCEDFGVLIQSIAEFSHRSCLLLTSREMLGGLGVLDGRDSPVRTLKVAGLAQEASQNMLKDKALFGEPEAWSRLVEHYGGNPLALKIVAEAVSDVFGGDIAAFLGEGHVLFQDILLLLNHQFERLSPLEQDLMYWLAIERDPVSLEELSANFIHTPSKSDLLEALKSLRRRCLVERVGRGAIFTLQPVVLEYVSERLIEQMAAEMSQGHVTLLIKYALMKGQTKEYIRMSQMRLLLQPLLKHLLTLFDCETELEQRLLLLTMQLREKSHMAQGYAGGNIVNLLVCLKGNISGLDFSRLMIRQAYLQGIEAQDTGFAHANLSDSVFMGTFDTIVSVALSPDGKYMAAGSFGGQICIWQVADGKQLLSFRGHSRITWSLAFSPDSTLLASGGYDRVVKLWDVSNGHCLHALKGHTEWVRAVTFSHDGNLLASCGNDATLKLWNVPTGTNLGTLRGHTSVVWSVDFHPDDSLLVSGSIDKTIRLWDVAKRECLAVLPAYAEPVFSVAFSPDGNFIASGGNNGVWIWDCQKQQPVGTLSSDISWTWSVAFAPEGPLASGGIDGSIALWDIATGQCLRTLQDHHGYSRIWSLACAPGNLLVSGSQNGIVKLWDTATGHCLRTFQGYSRVIYAVAFTPNKDILINGDDQGTIQMWEVATGRCLHFLQGVHVESVRSLLVSPDGKTCVSSGNDHYIKVWDIGSGECLKTLSGHAGEIWSLAFSPGGTLLASSSLDWTIKLWKIKEPTTESFKTLPGGHKWLWSLTFSPDSTILASSSDDGTVDLWEIASGARLKSLQGSASPLGTLAFSPDGKTLAGCSSDGKVWIWDVESGNCIRTLHGAGNANWVTSTAFSPDGQMLATGSDDTTIQLWSLSNEQNCREVKALIGHEGCIWSLAFSPDGQMLASGGGDGVTLLWDTHSGKLYKTLHNDGPFERMNIYGTVGLTQGQKASLAVLGAIEDPNAYNAEEL